MPANKRNTSDDQVDELDVKPSLKPSTPPSKKQKGLKASPSHSTTGSTPSSSPGSKGSKAKLGEMIIEAGIAHLSRSEAEAAVSRPVTIMADEIAHV